MLQSTDEEIWTYARAKDFVIVTQDADFETMSILRGAPPKVILLAIGNGPFRRATMLLENSADRLRDFYKQEDKGSGYLRLSLR